MSYQLACADFTFPLLPHDRVLKLISMLELEGVDIGLFEGRSHLWPSLEFDNVERRANELKKKVHDAGLRVADLFLQMSPEFEPFAINHPDASRRQKARDWFSRTLDYAAVCECSHVTTLPGVAFPDGSAGDSYSRALTELVWRVEKASERGITFGVEAHVGSLVPEPVLAAKLIQDVPGLTLTLDYTHFTRMGLPDGEIEPLLQYASHFHVRGACKGRLQTSFQQNVIDYGRILERMAAVQYSGWVGIEYVWIDWEQCNRCDNLSETIQFRDFVRRRFVKSSAEPGVAPIERTPSISG